MKARKQKPELKVGDRVRVYFTAGIGEKMAVVKVHNDDCLELAPPSGAAVFAHPRQCVRLRKREKQQERVERWIVFCLSDGVVSGHRDKRAAEIIAERKGARVIRMTELFPGEVLTDRRRLEAALKAGFWIEKDAPGLPAFLKALGLPKEGK